MSENIFAYEMDIATRKVTPISKDVIKDCDTTDANSSLFEPIPPDTAALQAYEEEAERQGRVMTFEELALIPPVLEKSDMLEYHFPDNRTLVKEPNQYEYSHICYLLIDTPKGTYRGSAFTFNSVAITSGHCLFGDDIWANNVRLFYRFERTGKFYQLPDAKSMIISAGHKVKEWDDWGMITFKSKHPRGGMGIVATNQYEQIKNYEMAITGFPAQVREQNNLTDMWTGIGKSVALSDSSFEQHPHYYTEIYATGGNSGGPLHCDWADWKAGYKGAAIGIVRGGRGYNGKSYVDCRAIESDMANFFGKIAERENKAR